ncbi:MAG: helix-turn-helix domain-containing protein [Bacilli bacterium]|nr:helix-turn-helix domain-containing protein [Bacilli bacterium]
MNFSENLKRLRKENNLSQEELAEKLKVSRQSVSKWESGTAYPEMDKIIQISNMFNVGIDELLNKDIKEVQEEKQTKNNINKYIDDFLNFITKSLDMFLNMKFKDKCKLIFEECFIAFMLFIFFSIIGSLFGNVFFNAFNFVNQQVLYFVKNLFDGIYGLITFGLSVIVMLHIFKTRYLDYYVVVDKEDLDNTDNNEEIKKNFVPEKREKVIIRDPEHSGYKFINGLLKVLLVLIKINVAFIFVGFCFSFIGLIVSFVLSFAISKTGLFFVGVLLSILSGIVINFIILNILFNFILSHKCKWLFLFITFIVSLVLLGSGIGLGTIGFSKFDFVREESYEVEDTLPMNDNSFIINHYNSNYNYVESDNSDIRVVMSCPNTYTCYVENEDNIINIRTNYKEMEGMKIFRKVLKDFNNKKIVTDDHIEVNIYTNKENIDRLQNNFEEYIRGE